VDQNTRFGDLTVASFVTRLASGEPVPGGGSAAAVAGSLAAALVSMVSALSEGRPRYAQHAALHAEVRPAARALADRFLALADDDAVAYAGYIAALKMPKETAAERETRAGAIREAARASSRAPFGTVAACLEVVTLAESLAGRSNRNAASDLEVSALLSVATAGAAAANVYVNLPAMGDETAGGELRERTEGLVREIDQLAGRIRAIVASGEDREPIEPDRA
jgi:formiminotetrahydrofolate cyclodeaminase